MEKSRKKSTVVIAIVLLVSVFYLGYRVVESRNHTDSLTEKAMENDVRTVAIVHAEPLPAQETIQLPGTIEAWFQAPIYAQVSGYVKMWHKDWGARVKKGDILAEINAPALDAQYRQAKADLASEVALNDLADTYCGPVDSLAQKPGGIRAIDFRKGGRGTSPTGKG